MKIAKRFQAMSAAVFLLLSSASSFAADELSVESAPPVIVKTVPQAGSSAVDPKIKEIKVTFSKDMTDRSWSWVQLSKESFPESTGDASYTKDSRTFVLPVKLQPNRTYAIWLNKGKYQNFKDANGQSAVPYLLIFRTSN